MLKSKSLVILTIALIMLMSACFPPYKLAPNAQFEEKGVRFSKLEVEAESVSHDLFFAESGDSSKQMVLFVHGTPGSWQGYEYYLQASELTSRAHLVAVDRPGFGQSVDGKWLPSFSEQAALPM